MNSTATNDIFPDVVRIETSGLCNFNCIYCPRHFSSQKSGLMSQTIFDLLVEQLRHNNAIPRVAVLYHGGEPLLDINLEKRILQLKAQGVKKTVITTNASLLTEERAKNLLGVGLDEVKISFDGENPQENDKQRIHGHFYNDAQNVRTFLSLCAKGGYRTKIILSNLRLLDRERFQRERMTDSHIGRLATPPNYLMDYFSEFIEFIEIQSFQPMAWPGINHNVESYSVEYAEQVVAPVCSTVYETITVRHDGSVVPCCYDLLGQAVQGNITITDIFEIWRSDSYTQFRQKVSDATSPPTLCQSCLVFSPKLLFPKGIHDVSKP